MVEVVTDILIGGCTRACVKCDVVRERQRNIRHGSKMDNGGKTSSSMVDFYI